jgi:c-di-GMP-binding flagellar brake protein YcgR
MIHMLHANAEAAHDEPAPPPVERRRAPRVDWPVTAHMLERVTVGRRSQPRAAEAHTVNISLTGVLISVQTPCQAGETLLLRFPLDRGADFTAEAEVVRIDDRSDPAAGTWLLGCEFRDVSVKQRCTLARFLIRRRAEVLERNAPPGGYPEQRVVR